MSWRNTTTALCAAAAAVILCSCAAPGGIPREYASRENPAPGAVLKAAPLDRAVEDRILALDPERVTDADVRTTLAKGPVPHVILLAGGIYPVHLAMESFARFLMQMGYPIEKIRHPGDGRWSHTPYEPSEQITGLAAWYYERDGVRPMLIGHSQGGIIAVKMLYELDGQFGPQIAVWSPLTDASERRTAIVDPLTGRQQPVVGMKLPYVSVVGAGGSAMLLPNMWPMAGKLRVVPDTVEDFVGYRVAVDLFALNLPGDDFRPNGKANVRNVTLPALYNHVTVPITEHLGGDPATRAWINAYYPGNPAAADPPGTGLSGILWAADVWWDLKKHWVLEQQRFVRARRAAPGQP